METEPPLAHRLVLTVIAVGLLCRLVFVFFTPTFYAPDEEAHFNYIKYLAENHAFPVMPTPAPPGNLWEYCQPPLYYLSMVPLYYAAQSALGDVDGTIKILRCASVLFWLFNLWLAVTLLRRLQVKDGFTWVFVMGLASLLPTYTFTSSAVNNDNLLALFSSGLLCLVASRRQTLGHSILLGLLLGCALLTKQSATVFIPMIALLAAQECLSQRTRWPLAAWYLGVTLAIAGLMYAPWALRNWQLYGTFTPELVAVHHKVWPSVAYGISSAVHNLVKTFWAASGISNNVGYPFPLAGMLLLLLFLIAPYLGRKQETQVDALKANQPVMVAFLFAVLLYIALTLRFGYVLGMGQGRHLFPVLIPIALLLAARLRRLPLKNAEWWVAGFWVAYAVSFMVFSLRRFPSCDPISGA